MTYQMTFVVDDDVPMVPLVEALNAAGLTISNIGGFRFRVHRLPGHTKVVSLAARVIDLAERRRRDTATDAQIRDGLHSLFDPPQPGAT